MVSRAYLKMEEALRWSALPAARGDVWVELGCAPGGASQALLNRGFEVIGVDPAEVDEPVASHPHFTHLRKRSAEVRRVEFAAAKWLAADLNVAPQYTLDAVEDVVRQPTTSIRGLVLTLKLATWEVASPERMSEYVERVKSWGFRDVRLRQLVHNRHELCLVALHSRAQRRMKRTRKQRAPRSQRISKPDNDRPDVRFDAPTRMLPPHHFR
jgi:23S rRNA (cytidine2498-2'-O)-methyltransferase